jgi:hypothetical protein
MAEIGREDFLRSLQTSEFSSLRRWKLRGQVCCVTGVSFRGGRLRASGAGQLFFEVNQRVEVTLRDDEAVGRGDRARSLWRPFEREIE